jgi:hypothetical protein
MRQVLRQIAFRAAKGGQSQANRWLRKCKAGANARQNFRSTITFPKVHPA